MCQCDIRKGTYREDTNECIDTIAKCDAASFVTDDVSENIPFVFLPLHGQLVYPSAYISLPDDEKNKEENGSICVVSYVEMMTNQGWMNINNITSSVSLEFQQPFQLYRENAEKIYIQWMGHEVLHQTLEGRLVLLHLLCKSGVGAGSQGARRLFSPCVAFRIAGTVGRSVPMENYGADSGGNGGITQRDYITIGICAGFLVLLYLFGMTVLIVIKKKQRRDAMLREQFLNMPLPSGLGYKSSRILGLDSHPEKQKFHDTEKRYYIENKRDILQEKTEEKIYDITKNGSGKEDYSEAESDHSSVMELNEKLLEAHKKVVQQKLNKEIAKEFVSGDVHSNLSKKTSSKILPTVKEMPGENLNHNDVNPITDSGNVTRSGSSYSQSNDNDDDYNDQSDEDDTIFDDQSENFSQDEMFSKKSQINLAYESDIVSDIYSTAFSKVPKVPDDMASIYSLTSTIDKDFDYDSLDQRFKENLRHIYRNPNITHKSTSKLAANDSVVMDKEDSYEEILLSKDSNVKKMPGVYINNDYDINTCDNDSETEIINPSSTSNNQNDDDKLIYSSEEKMLITIMGNNEHIVSNKLKIEVNQNEKIAQPVAKKSNEAKQKVWTNFAGAEIRRPEDKSNVPSSHETTVNFRNHGEVSPRRPTSDPPDPPSLPPKLRGTPRLPPKPLDHGSGATLNRSSSVQVLGAGAKRPLPPLPPPRMPPPPPPMKK